MLQFTRPSEPKIEVEFLAEKMFCAETNIFQPSAINPQFCEIVRSYEPGWNIYGNIRSYETPRTENIPEGNLPIRFYLWSGNFKKQNFSTGVIELKDKNLPKGEGEAVLGVIVPYADNLVYNITSTLRPAPETEEELLKECIVRVTKDPELNKAKISRISDKKIDKKFKRIGKHFSFIGVELKPLDQNKGYINYGLLDEEIYKIIPNKLQENAVYSNIEEEFTRKNIERAFKWGEIFLNYREKIVQTANQQLKEKQLGEPEKPLKLLKPDIEHPIIVEAFHVNPETKQSYVTYDIVQRSKYMDKERNPKPSLKGISLVSTIPIQAIKEQGEGGYLKSEMHVLLNRFKGFLESTNYSRLTDLTSNVVDQSKQAVYHFNEIFGEGGRT